MPFTFVSNNLFALNTTHYPILKPGTNIWKKVSMIGKGNSKYAPLIINRPIGNYLLPSQGKIRLPGETQEGRTATEARVQP